MCLFRFNPGDLEAFHKYKKATEPDKFGKTTAWQLVMMLPLSALKGFVRREYFDGALQAANMEKWYADFLLNPAVAVDLNGRHLVSGGPEGMKAFNQCWDNQMRLALAQKMSGTWKLERGDIMFSCQLQEDNIAVRLQQDQCLWLALFIAQAWSVDGCDFQAPTCTC